MALGSDGGVSGKGVGISLFNGLTRYVGVVAGEIASIVSNTGNYFTDDATANAYFTDDAKANNYFWND